MGVLDTLYILFESDAKKVEEGTKKAKGSVDKLEDSIAGTEKASVDLGAKFNDLATVAVASFASVFAVTQLIANAKGIAAQSTELAVLGEILGESTSEITNWSRAVQSVGGDTKAFESTLRGLNSKLNDALVTGPNDASRALGILGISVLDSNGQLKSTLDLLPQIAGKFGELDRVDQLSLGSMLGLDEGTILLMSRGGDAVDGLVSRQRSLNRVTDEQTGQLRLLTARFNEYDNLLSDVATQILVALLPAINAIEKGLVSFMSLIRDNQDVVMTFFTGLAVILAALAIKALILATPFILMGVAIGAVAFAIGALVVDIQNFVSGQDSMLGRAAERWSIVGDAIAGIGSAIQFVIDLVGTLGGIFASLEIPDFLAGLGQSALGLLDKLDAGFQNLTGEDVETGQNALRLVNDTPVQALGAENAAAGSSSSKSTSVSIGEITVETNATDADGIARELGSVLENQLQQAIDTSDDGVAA